GASTVTHRRTTKKAAPPTRGRRQPCDGWDSEGSGAVRRAEAGRSVPAGPGRAELGGVAGPVAARRHVEQRRGVRVREAVVDAARVSGQGVDAGDDRRGGAGAADDEPTGLVLERG